MDSAISDLHQSLLTALRVIVVRLTASKDSAGLKAGSARRFAQVVERLELGETLDVDRDCLERATRNALALRAALDPGLTLDAALLVVRQHLASELLRDTRDATGARATGRQPSGMNNELSMAYATDAANELAAARSALITAAGTVLLSIFIAVWASWLVSNAPASKAMEALLSPMIASLAAFAMLVFLLLQIRSRQRNAREYIRLSRALGGLDNYLESLPEAAQFLIRATLTPSLFPRLLDDDDPLRQISWPSENSVMTAIYGYGEEQVTPGADALPKGVDKPVAGP